jgi:hypothetical protein
MYKFDHRTIIEQNDYMRLTQEITHVLWSVFIEENQNRREDYIEDSPYGESAEFTQKGEDVFSSFEDHAENLVKNTLQIEFHGNDMEWRSKEELLRKPF